MATSSSYPNPSFFPGGFASGLVVRNMPLALAHPGVVWWVSNSATLPSNISSQRIPYVNGSDGNKGTWNAPFATIGKAFSFASPGDIIMVKPGHAETVSAAAGMLWNVANVAVIGLGNGSNRPSITLDTANTATISVTAADITLQNFQFTANFLSIATVFSLTTAKNFNLQNCTFTDKSNVLTFLSIVTTDSTANHADGLTVQNCVWTGSTNTTATACVTIGAALEGADMVFVTIGAGIDQLMFSDNTIWLGVLNTSGACVTGAFVPTHTQVLRNTIYRLNTAMSAGLALDTTAAVTALVMDNRAGIGVDTITSAVWVTNAGAVLSNNRSNLTSQNTVSMLETPVQDV